MQITITFESGDTQEFGRLFKEQRSYIVGKLFTSAKDSEDERNLQGLTNFLEVIAYQCHDVFGIDCLLTEDDEEQPAQITNVPIKVIGTITAEGKCSECGSPDIEWNMDAVTSWDFVKMNERGQPVFGNCTTENGDESHVVCQKCGAEFEVDDPEFL
jgi:Fe2+ or Zn2+ uptake regulation protein